MRWRGGRCKTVLSIRGATGTLQTFDGEHRRVATTAELRRTTAMMARMPPRRGECRRWALMRTQICMRTKARTRDAGPRTTPSVRYTAERGCRMSPVTPTRSSEDEPMGAVRLVRAGRDWGPGRERRAVQLATRPGPTWMQGPGGTLMRTARPGHAGQDWRMGRFRGWRTRARLWGPEAQTPRASGRKMQHRLGRCRGARARL